MPIDELETPLTLPSTSLLPAQSPPPILQLSTSEHRSAALPRELLPMLQPSSPSRKPGMSRRVDTRSMKLRLPPPRMPLVKPFPAPQATSRKPRSSPPYLLLPLRLLLRPQPLKLLPTGRRRRSSRPRSPLRQLRPLPQVPCRPERTRPRPRRRRVACSPLVAARGTTSSKLVSSLV